MSNGSINLGSIYCDLDVRSDNLDRGLAKARTALDAIDREVKQLQSDLASGAISLADYGVRMAALGTTTTDLTNRMNAAYTATTTLSTGLEIINAKANAMTNSAGRMGQGLMNVGYIIDDIQYGFQGIVNNIAPLVSGFTSAAGMTATQTAAIAASAQIGAVAIYQLYKNYDLLMEKFGQGMPPAGFEGLEALTRQIKELDKEIDKLRSKPHLTVQDFIDLQNSEKKVGALGAAAKDAKAAEDMQGPTKEERERGSAFTDAVREQGASNVQDALLEHYKQKADNEGSTLDRQDIEGMLTDKGFSPGSIKATDVGALSKMFGVKMNAADMQEKANAGGGSIGKQVVDALAKEKFLMGDKPGEMLTADQMTNRRLRQGKEGDKDVAKEIGDVLDAKLPNFGKTQTAAGEIKTQLPSTFSKEFGENSPEAKEAKKKEDKEQTEFDRRKNKEARDEDAEAEKQIKEAEDSGKAIVAMRKKNEQHRRENEQKSREAAPGVKDMSEALAGQVHLGALTPDEAREQIKQYLKENGRNEKQATAASEDIYEDAEKDVREGIIKRSLGKQDEMKGGRGQREKKTVDVFDASQVASRFQSSVGAGNGVEAKLEKANGILENIQKALDAQAKSGAINVRVAKK